FLPHVRREQVVLVDGRGARRQLGGDEGLHLFAQHVDGVAKCKVEAGIVHGATCCLVVVLCSGCSAISPAAMAPPFSGAPARCPSTFGAGCRVMTFTLT